jgi:hypothetical protein
MGPWRSRSSTAEAWSDFHEATRGASLYAEAPTSAFHSRFPLPTGRPSRWRAPPDHAQLRPGTLRGGPEGLPLLFAVLLNVLLHDLS